tara:strand:- start:7944 stop:8369 length:426 start_codon:yes stop_codon:yes gene_type:complete
MVFLSMHTANAQSDDAQTIKALLETVAAYMQAGDMESLGDVYAPGRGVHIIEGSGVNHGWDDYRDNHLGPELNAYKNFTYKYLAIEPVVKGEFAFVALRYELTADTDSGHIEMEGRGTTVLEKMEGRWRIVHTHTSGRRRN